MNSPEQLSRAIVEAMPNPLFIVGADDKIMLANSAAEDFFQASFQMLQKYPVVELFPFSSPAMEAIAKVRSAGGVENE